MFVSVFVRLTVSSTHISFNVSDRVSKNQSLRKSSLTQLVGEMDDALTLGLDFASGLVPPALQLPEDLASMPATIHGVVALRCGVLCCCCFGWWWVVC